jgi:hypothetical protein
MDTVASKSVIVEKKKAREKLLGIVDPYSLHYFPQFPHRRFVWYCIGDTHPQLYLLTLVPF